MRETIRRAGVAGALLLAVFQAAALAAETPVLPLQPTKVEVSGTLHRKSFFVRPGAGLDAREVHLVLQLDEPVRVVSAGGVALTETDTFQVAANDGSVTQMLELLEGRRAVLSGSLFIGHTEHHFTRVLVHADTARPLAE